MAAAGLPETARLAFQGRADASLDELLPRCTIKRRAEDFVVDEIDEDESGTLTKVEIVEAVKSNKDVINFLRTCGEENLQFLLVPARLAKALEVLDTSKDGEVDLAEWEEAIHRGLAKRLKQLQDERDRRDRPRRLHAPIACAPKPSQPAVCSRETPTALEISLRR